MTSNPIKDIIIILIIFIFSRYIKSERLKIFLAMFLTIISIFFVIVFLLFKKEDLANTAAYFTFVFLFLDFVVYSSLITGKK